MNQQPTPFWSIPDSELLQELGTTTRGLKGEEAAQRLVRYGANLLKPKRKTDAFTLFISQFNSPIILILLFAAGLSFFLAGTADAVIILTIVFVSGLLGFWQEQGAANAVEGLLAIVRVKAWVFRDGSPVEVPFDEVVPGDVLVVSAGSGIPGDCRILESNDLFIDEAALTGETYPEEKEAGVLPSATPLSQRTNSLFMGTHVISGSATVVVVRTGTDTEFGKVSERLRLKPPETEFEHGIRHFGYLLMEVTLLMVGAIFTINVFLARPILESFLFALALAVGLTPQLLPAIISINLAHGAKLMAQKKVVVKRLSAIENFGSMNVLCSDKTGTITEGVVRLHSALHFDGAESEKVLLYAYLNASYETGFANPIDEAIRTYRKFDLTKYTKLDEVPYDFIRKRLSILAAEAGRNLMITKGALSNVLSICSSAEAAGGEVVELATLRTEIDRRFEELSGQGLRLLGIAYRDTGVSTRIDKTDEIDMTFLGFLVFFDPPKPNIVETVRHLKNVGVSLKVITGDNLLVAMSVSKQVELENPKFLAGPELHNMSDEALLQRVNGIDVFAEIEPNQKERIIHSLKKAGNVVGYMGDGINDASALHAADVGISVDSAVDVAKEAAQIVLLEKDLGVLLHGVKEGRTTFANTLKYVFMATSANFGNMFSMAGASLFLPFLPLLPKQILLTNMLTDLPEMNIATDSVDGEMIDHPRRWNINFIRSFMMTFGALSSVFDFLTFGMLLFILNSSPVQFRTGWFVESVVSASIIVLVIRTRKPFYRSRPGKYLLMTTVAIVIVTVISPFTPVAELFGFEPLPISFMFILAIIVVLYIASAEVAKKVFFQRVGF